jgi:glyoxylase-like metal-dependent hydrolase (beta-lactamase superfamily II)
VSKKEAIVIDPGMNSIEITQVVEDYKVKYILNTHGHFDHIGGNTFVKSRDNAQLVIHKADAEMLIDPNKNLSQYFGMEPIISIPANILLEDESMEFCIGDSKLSVLYVPGHSEGSVAYYCEKEKSLFAGDLIFSATIGRIDLPGGNLKKIKESVKKVLKLPDDTLVYPGHEEPFLLSDFKEIAKHIFDGV